MLRPLGRACHVGSPSGQTNNELYIRVEASSHRMVYLGNSRTSYVQKLFGLGEIRVLCRQLSQQLYRSNKVGGRTQGLRSTDAYQGGPRLVREPLVLQFDHRPASVLAQTQPPFLLYDSPITMKEHSQRAQTPRIVWLRRRERH